MADSGGTSGSPVGGGTPLSGVIHSTRKSNLFPLESWRQSIGYHPWHFWGMSDDNLIKLASACNRAIPNYAWQDADMPSREALRQAIMTAETRLREHLHFSVGKRFVRETLTYPRPRDRRQQFGASVGSEARWLPLQVSENYVQSVGIEAIDYIQADSAVVLSDEDGDTYQDTFTLTASTTVTDPDEIAVYFASADRLNGEPISENYRIAPISVKIDSGTLTIKGPAWILVKPIKYEGLNARSIDPATVGTYATVLDVCRRYCDPTGTTLDTAQAVLVWETSPFPRWAICCDNGVTFADGSADPAAEAYAIARVGIRDGRLGAVYAGNAVYDATTEKWSGANWGLQRQPDRVIIRYQAGVPIDALADVDNGSYLLGKWDKIVSRLACAELNQRQWACDEANQEIYRWQFNLATTGGANGEQYRISEGNLSNPFGTAAGAIYAWNQVKHLGINRAVLL